MAIDENSGQEFARLKNDLIYHDRLKGCFEYSVSAELFYWLEDKSKGIENAKEEFVEKMSKVEQVATMPFRQQWSALRVPSYLELDLEPRYLVSSPYYELPEAADRETMLALLHRIEGLASDLPASEEGSLKDLRRVMDSMKDIDWSKQDINSLISSLSAKVNLMEEIANLSTSLQDTQWAMSRLEAKKEELRRKEENALASGEVDIAAEVIKDRMVVHEELFRFSSEKVAAIKETNERCSQERKNKVNQWKQGAASIEVLREAKQRKRDQCSADLQRLQRGMDYEAVQAEGEKLTHLESLEAKDAQIEGISTKIKEHVTKLGELAEQWKGEEEKIRRMIEERQSLIGERLQLVTNEAQRLSDFQEFISHCTSHQGYITNTDALCGKADEALEVLQRYTTGSSRFLDQDFHQTRDQLTEMGIASFQQLAALHSDFTRDIGTLINRSKEGIAKLDEKIVEAEIHAESCRETLDPLAKKHVNLSRKMVEERAQLQTELDALIRQKESALKFRETAVEGLKEARIVLPDPEDDVKWGVLLKKEKMLDNRDELLEGEEERIVAERDSAKQYQLKSKGELAMRQEELRERQEAIAEARRVRDQEMRELQRASAYGLGDPDPLPLVVPRSMKQPVGSPKTIVRRETRSIAGVSYSETEGRPQPYEGRQAAKEQAAPGSSAGGEEDSERGSDAPAADSLKWGGRATPLELARSRRPEPRTIVQLQEEESRNHSLEEEVRQQSRPNLLL